MLNTPFKILICGFCLLTSEMIFAQSKSNLDQKINQLEQKLGVIQQDMGRFQKLLDNRAMLELFQRVDELADELSQQRGEIEQLGHDMTGVKKRQRELYLDTDRRLRELEHGGKNTASSKTAPILIPEVNTLTPVEDAPVQPPKKQTSTDPTPAPETPSPAVNNTGGAAGKTGSNLDKRVSQAVQKLLGSGTGAATANTPTPSPKPVTGSSTTRKASKTTVSEERKKYQKAFDMLKEGRYKVARAEFKSFLKQYPDGRYSGNAQYWLGEANYVTRQFDQGVKEFKLVLSKYPASNKVPDAMLKLGYTYYELRQTKQARLVLEDLRKRFPKSTAARLAGKRLERMKKEGL